MITPCDCHLQFLPSTISQRPFVQHWANSGHRRRKLKYRAYRERLSWDAKLRLGTVPRMAPDGPGICDVALCCTEVAKIQSHGMNPRVVVFHTPRLQWCSTRVEIDCSVKMRSSWRESYDSMVLSETEKEPESCQKAATKLPHSLHTSSMMHDTANVFWVAVHKLVCSECMRV